MLKNFIIEFTFTHAVITDQFLDDAKLLEGTKCPYLQCSPSPMGGEEMRVVPTKEDKIGGQRTGGAQNKGRQLTRDSTRA